MVQLTKAEEEIMQIIWLKNRCMVSEIIEELGDATIPHSTVSSVVRILEKKGFVAHKAYGKTHEYYPIIERDSYTKKGLKGWINSYFDGSPTQLVSFLVKNEELNTKQLNELIQQLEKLKK